MTTAAPSTALATIQPAFTDPERLALAEFLAGYRGLTREPYALACGSENNNAVRPGPRQPRPARHLHCRRLRRRRRPVTRTGWQQLCLAVTAARRTGLWSPDDDRPEKVTERDLNTNRNRRSGCVVAFQGWPVGERRWSRSAR
jgi:hypothetical protein